MTIQPKLYTVDEFETLLFSEENMDKRFELIDGEVVEKVPTEEHSLVTGNLYTGLRVFVKAGNLGRVVFEARFRVPSDDHNARLPDIAFTRADRLLPVVTKGAVPLMPDLCVEVKSPYDSLPELRRKAAYYLANGAQLVWLVYPAKRMIEVYRADGSIDILLEHDGDILSGEDVLPGFSMPLSAIFEL